MPKRKSKASLYYIITLISLGFFSIYILNWSIEKNNKANQEIDSAIEMSEVELENSAFQGKLQDFSINNSLNRVEVKNFLNIANHNNTFIKNFIKEDLLKKREITRGGITWQLIQVYKEFNLVSKKGIDTHQYSKKVYGIDIVNQKYNEYAKHILLWELPINGERSHQETEINSIFNL